MTGFEPSHGGATPVALEEETAQVEPVASTYVAELDGVQPGAEAPGSRPESEVQDAATRTSASAAAPTATSGYASADASAATGDDRGDEGTTRRTEGAQPGSAPVAGKPEASISWLGAFEPFSVGDPGRATKRVTAAPATGWPDRRDTVVDGFTVTDRSGRQALHLRAASLRGLSHRYYGTVRQDEYAIRSTQDHVVIAVADGVGSLPMSHFAAEIATRATCNEVLRQLAGATPIDWSVVFTNAGANILERGARFIDGTAGATDAASSRDDVTKHMATTIRVAVIDIGREAPFLPVVLHGVGDTSAWVLHSDGSWSPTGEVKNEGATIASSAVAALPFVATELAPSVTFELQPGEVLAVMTDGLGDALGDGSGDVGRFLAEMWQTPPVPLAFAAHVDLARRTFDDDRTAVCVWPGAK